MQWDDTKYAGFSKHTPWLGVNENYTKINVKAEENDSTSILNFYKKLVSIRLSNEALRRGNLEFLFESSNTIFSYKIELEKEEFVCISNFSKSFETIDFPFSDYNVLLNTYGDNLAIQSNNFRPYEAVLLKRK